MTETIAEPTTWAPPVPWAEPVAYPFPVEVLPPAVAAFAQEAAAALGCAVDLVAAPLVAGAGAMIGTARLLELREDRCERSAVALAVVAGPALGAPEALRLVLEPLYRAQGRILARYQERLAAHEIDRAQYRPPKPRPVIVFPDDEYLYAPRVKPRPPVLTRLCAADIPAGSLADLVQQNPRGTLLLPGDLPAWLAGLSSTGRRLVRAAWAGHPVYADRRGHPPGPVLVHEPFLGILGSAGPERLPLLRAEAARADALLDGFLFTFPAPRPVARWARAAFPAEARRTWAKVLSRLRRLAGDPERPNRPVRLRLDYEGHSAWVRFYDGLADEIDALGPDSPLRGPWARLRSYGARLALVLHYLWWAGLGCTEEAEGSCVGPVDVERAVVLTEYFQGHAQRVYTEMNADPAIGRARLLLHWLERTRLREFSRRQAHRALRGASQQAADLDGGLDLLCRQGYLRPKENGDRPGPGRKPGPAFEVNPGWPCRSSAGDPHFVDFVDFVQGGPGAG
jgi:hypothetical protein